jgi:hypothetical protein
MKINFLLIVSFASISHCFAQFPNHVDSLEKYENKYWAWDDMDSEYNASKNTLKALLIRKQSTFNDLSNLKKLENVVTDFNIKYIDSNLNSCRSLKILSIRAKNPRYSPYLKPIPSLIHFNTLNYAKSVPGFVYRCDSLESLWLNLYNEISLSDSITRFKHLTWLDLEFKKNTIVPDYLFKIKTLKTLHLRCRKKMTIPEGIEQVDTNLVALDLDIDLAKNIPFILKFKNLKYLEVDKYNSKDLEPLKQLYFLKTIYIRSFTWEQGAHLYKILPKTEYMDWNTMWNRNNPHMGK